MPDLLCAKHNAKLPLLLWLEYIQVTDWRITFTDSGEFS